MATEFGSSVPGKALEHRGGAERLESLTTRCLAELAIEARRYVAGYITHGDRELGEFEGGSCLGPQRDGRWAFRFGQEDDALAFRDEATRIAESYGLDGEIAVQLYRDGHCTAYVRLTAVAS